MCKKDKCDAGKAIPFFHVNFYISPKTTFSLNLAQLLDALFSNVFLKLKKLLSTMNLVSKYTPSYLYRYVS